MKLTFQALRASSPDRCINSNTSGKRYLLDCGMFQGRRKEAERKIEISLPCLVDRCRDTFARHIDHSGRLPLLVKNGNVRRPSVLAEA